MNKSINQSINQSIIVFWYTYMWLFPTFLGAIGLNVILWNTV